MTELEKLKMDDEYITQNDFVQRYLQNKLTPEETVEFEEYILDKPELLERLELDSILTEHLPTAIKVLPSPILKKMSWWKPLFSNLTAVAACSLLVAVLLFDKPNYSNISPDVIYLEDFRGDQTEFIVNFAKGSNEKVIIIQPKTFDIDNFKVDIRRENSSLVVKHWPSLQKNLSGDLVINLNKSDLPPDSYKMILTHAESSNVDSVFSIKIM
jgi:hypothetical protein